MDHHPRQVWPQVRYHRVIASSGARSAPRDGARTELREQLAEAEREDARLDNAALTDGRTAEVLRELGLGEPEKKGRTPAADTPDQGWG